MKEGEMIQLGDRIPDGVLREINQKGVQEVLASHLFSGKRVIVFGVPGAFTPICSETHVPSFIKHVAECHKKGIDQVFCVSVNDPFVMDAWRNFLDVSEEISFLADGNGTWVKSLGLTFDASAFGLGERAQRFALLIEDGILKLLELEQTPGVCHLTSGESFVNKI
jgi:peroxiredoxin